MQLPTLTGTSAQIERAERYREFMSAAIASVAVKAMNWLRDNGQADLAARVDEASNRLLATTDAAWWIAHEPRLNAWDAAITRAEAAILDALGEMPDDEADAVRDGMDS